MASAINGIMNGSLNGRHLPPPIAIAQQAGRLAPLSVVAHQAGASPVRSPNASSGPSLPSPAHAPHHPVPRLHDPHDTHDTHDLHDSTRPEYTDEGDDNADGEPEGDSTSRPRKKQKRNKPTLSCHECVDRKTKVSSLRRRIFTVA
jgi:hypothetical protein